MAEIPLYFVDLQDDLDDYGFEDYGPDCDSMRVTAFLDVPGQDNLPPLTRLEKYAFSDNIFNRQIIARGLLDIFRDFSSNEEDFVTVMEIVVRLSEDAEPTVRTELMEQIPPVAMFLQENTSNFPVVLSDYLIPVVVRYLTDPNNQVRKSSQEVLLILLEQDLIFQHDIENKVCPLLLHLSAADSNDEYKAEAVNVRQAAFQSLGPFISTFANPSRAGLYIREDGILSIRPPAQARGSSSPPPGSCADTSSACLLRSAQGLPPPIPPSSRKPVQREPDVPLEGTFLETSHSPHVSRSPNGPTEDPTEGCAVAVDRLPRLSPGPSAFSKLPDLSDRPANSHPGPGSSACPGSPEDVFSNLLYWQTPLPDISKDLELLLGKAGQQEDICCGSKTVPSSCVPSSEIQKVLDSLQEDMMNDPDIQAQVQVLSAALRAAQLDSENASESQPTGDLNEVPAADPPSASGNQIALSASSSPDTLAAARILQSTGPDKDHDGTSDPLQAEQRHNPTPHEENKSKLQHGGFPVSPIAQDIIPQPLLDQYVSMTDPARAQTVDTDIAKHCAYSLPGVALALGRQNWHCLKDTYETLASDVQWKVRRTLAFSIHELAVILGDQLTAADLVPIFNGFLKDLDEVRIGVLKHLYDFLKLLHADKRREYLYQLQEFVVTDNNRNWRFRYELAEQLILILELYNPQDVYDYLTHIALKLCADKVSEVRWISFRLAVAILHKFYSHSQSALGLNFINELIVRFRHCPKWVGRQAFAFICQAAVSEECVPVDQFVEHLLPSLLSLASDPVPNVRVLLAKALKQTLLEKAYFRNVGNPHLKVVEETVLALQSDRDQDVSFFATLEPKRRNIIDTTVLEKQD
ncbi:serine/threonine-protein phosphatase 4 regulatory subunit 1-like isoform X6 [Elephas maximus indicus]|uniref:serine/threonine-protein phosphatase 4 regulatory subunit 1-like isoform X6 n=1 Tax=Elephas maximus indicus TaxID=99487 RepID=UPI0021165080|nr:serine/threonine-protein phosphatase 4 regulatory subunit 1-like isoform X6 [Elephas maximus indicus]